VTKYKNFFIFNYSFSIEIFNKLYFKLTKSGQAGYQRIQLKNSQYISIIPYSPVVTSLPFIKEKSFLHENQQKA
jgi:hypothetical protein